MKLPSSAAMFLLQAGQRERRLKAGAELPAEISARHKRGGFQPGALTIKPALTPAAGARLHRHERKNTDTATGNGHVAFQADGFKHRLGLGWGKKRLPIARQTPGAFC